MLPLKLISLLVTTYTVVLPWTGPVSGPSSSGKTTVKFFFARTQTDELARGQIIERVVCRKENNPRPVNTAGTEDAEQSYALYLPSTYTSTRKWPILYAFDPGARGKFPVERFKDAAEKYGWILVGSNNSHNGPIQAAVDAWKAMWADTHERFAIDQGRIYTTGFSGGARVAVLLANICVDCVAGVIGCGAGFPSGVSPAPTMHFAFFGTVGVDDFNFPEVRALDEALLKAGLTHNVRMFPGRHEWAPPAVAEEAIEWMELQAMRTDHRVRDDNLINELWQKYSAAGNAFEAANRPYDSYQILAGMPDSFKGLHDTSDAEKRAGQLRDNRAVKDALRDERQQILRQREKEREIYTLIAASATEEAFDSGVRLRASIAELQKSARAEKDSGERRVARRVSEGLFIGLFEQGQNLMQAQKSYDQAARKFELATVVAPERPGAFFYLACAYALNGDKKRSLLALKSATEKGFADLGAITDNKAFDSLRNEPQYQQIIQALTKGH